MYRILQAMLFEFKVAAGEDDLSVCRLQLKPEIPVSIRRN